MSGGSYNYNWRRPLFIHPMFFSGFCYFLPFIVTPLAGKEQLGWSKSEKSFDNLRQLLTSTPVLHLPDPEEDFIMEVDTCVGTILSQKTCSD